MRDLSTELGWREDAHKVVARIPARTKLRAVRSLLGQRGRLASDLENRAGSLQEAEVERDDFEQTIEAFGTAPDVSGLRAVIKTIREHGDVTGRLRRGGTGSQTYAGSAGPTSCFHEPDSPKCKSRRRNAGATGDYGARASGQPSGLGTTHPRHGPAT